ncbi:beta-ketoacyl-[acyl-carrier-protein] synthase family protein [Sphingobacterium lumbrici]|uniref:beta-ketoacyl-[acyl-carrier-protein] synthase family protein n=1 Tax=Sphingobacterium lumbrici TaxID=2559600 RepID=UPI00112ABA94|nr:beta-ketoacyl synthase N-terminal-like domain-containing protein [Sphingobacterium lumbrici]
MNCVTPLGLDLQCNWTALLKEHTGIDVHTVGSFKNIYTAKIKNLPTVHEDLTYLETMLYLAIEPLIRSKTIHAKTGFILSTTKGNIDFLSEGKSEEAQLNKLAVKIAGLFGFITAPIVVSHACVSGLLAVSVAKRLIQMGQFDEVFVLAGDKVSEFVLSGFNAFQAMSASPCKPFDAERDGVTLGEAAGAILVTKSREGALVEIVGEGAINDANHISGPSRTGEGLYRSISSALNEAGIDATAIDFISAHGTATSYNDEMEAIAFDRLGMHEIPVNSLKGYYGHTLGASGLLELIISILSLQHNKLIPTKGFVNRGTSKDINIITQKMDIPLTYILKTASGFGGSNAAVILKRVNG